MNYRHAYHAGNFADVLKHAVLALVIDYLKRKEAPLRVIDTHAGAGRYLLASAKAQKTGEWLGGIGRLLGDGAAPLPQDAGERLRPYLDVVRRANPQGGLHVYPGSPLIALALMRPQDVLIANELHPEELAGLKAAIGGDRRAKTMALDAWVALKALLPPRERRGVVLIDPPFEEAGELERMVTGLARSLERFATGVYIAWYPIKDPKPIRRFRAALAGLGAGKLLDVELRIESMSDPERLNGCGLVVVNPPYTLEGDLALILPHLSRRLEVRDGVGGWHLERIAAAPGQAPAAAPRRKRRMRTRP
jgi:23S rRNA (adenine2030-N6)-methyltransferase